MSTDRESKWDKYFRGKDVTTTIKSNTFLYSSDGMILKELKAGTEVLVPASSTYSAHYYVQTEHGNGLVAQKYINKPVEHVESLGLSAAMLSMAGQDHMLNGIATKLFDDPSRLQDSIINGLENTHGTKTYSECIHRSFDSSDNHIRWNSNICSNHVNQLGKYLGELLNGVLLMKGQTKNFIDLPFSSTPVKFAIPVSSNHIGVDSFLIFSNSYVKPVSSKYGKGASASFFSNILPKAITTNLVSNSILQKLCQAAHYANVSYQTLLSKRGSKQVLYEFSIRNCLGLSNVGNTYAVFMDIKTNLTNIHMMSAESRMVMDHAKGICANAFIAAQLPYSLTAIFNRTATDRLNDCQQSLTEAKSVLLSKSVVQMHLSDTLWKQGEIKYDCLQSSTCEIKFWGNKGIVADIDSHHGMINYELKKPMASV